MKNITVEYEGKTITINPNMTIEQLFDFADELYSLIVDKEIGSYVYLTIDPAIRALFLSHCTDINYDGRNMLEVMNECATSDLFSKYIFKNKYIKEKFDEISESMKKYINDKYLSEKNNATESIVNDIVSGIKSLVDKLNGFDVDAAFKVIEKFNNMDEKEIIEEVVDKS